MRGKAELGTLFRRFLDVVSAESDKNPEFAAKLDEILSTVPRKSLASKAKPTAMVEALPDVHAEWRARGEAEFRLWLSHQPVPTIRAVIRSLDIDSTRKTTKWKEAEKLAAFVADNLRARSVRGSAFSSQQPPEGPRL